MSDKIKMEQLQHILAEHQKWLNDDGGCRADLCNADLCNADLRNADLCNADLRNADLCGANLRNADLDYSCMPLWCGDLRAHYDDRQIIQQLYHVLSHAANSKNCSPELRRELLIPNIVAIANRFHRVAECGKIAAYDEEAL